MGGTTERFAVEADGAVTGPFVDWPLKGSVTVKVIVAPGVTPQSPVKPEAKAVMEQSSAPGILRSGEQASVYWTFWKPTLSPTGARSGAPTLKALPFVRVTLALR